MASMYDLVVSYTTMYELGVTIYDTTREFGLLEQVT